MSDAERKELNLEAGKLIQSLGIQAAVRENGFGELREKLGYTGFAGYYLGHFYDDSELINQADIGIYNQLLEIDSKLGATQTEQLVSCVSYAVRMDLIQV